MIAAINGVRSFNAMSNHMALTVCGLRRHGVDRAFEAVECHHKSPFEAPVDALLADSGCWLFVGAVNCFQDVTDLRLAENAALSCRSQRDCRLTLRDAIPSIRYFAVRSCLPETNKVSTFGPMAFFSSGTFMAPGPPDATNT
jgi:hypothetical protein